MYWPEMFDDPLVKDLPQIGILETTTYEAGDDDSPVQQALLEMYQQGNLRKLLVLHGGDDYSATNECDEINVCEDEDYEAKERMAEYWKGLQEEYFDWPVLEVLELDLDQLPLDREDVAMGKFINSLQTTLP